MKITLQEYKRDVPNSKLKRIGLLKKEFINTYKMVPSLYVRTPGHVNIIGEHIDYSGYGVLPLAIDKDIIIAISKRTDNILELGNLNKFLYKPVTIDFDYNKLLKSESLEVKEFNIDDIMIDSHSPKWYDYFLAGFKGGLIKIKENKDLIGPFGMNVLICSDLPACSGLSSSSALVCAATLCILALNEIYLTRLDMAQICATSERYIGTYGGGMDQAICFLSKEHQATLINFDPITAKAVQIPENGEFVIANSCAPMDKGNTPHYNIRVSECRISAQVTYKLACKADAISKDGTMNGWRDIDTIKQMQDLLEVGTLHELACLFRRHLKPEPYTRVEIMDILEILDDADYMESCLRNKILPGNQEFKLLDRALHVCNEAQRVIDFASICDNDDAKDPTRLVKLGSLMNDSHQSCRDLFECSHPKLDQLVGICREYGALGSRLTGAGWGGCCVSLVPKPMVQKFIQQVSEKFYNNCPPDASFAPSAGDTKGPKPDQADHDLPIFSTHPSQGASIYIY